jgi:nucleoside-diphosphate-sugar epimerase
MRVVVVGSTGVLGRYLIPRLLERNHRVRAVMRDENKAKLLRHMGADCVLGDILDPESMTAATKDSDAVLHIATAIVQAATTIAPPRNPQEWHQNDRVRREGTMNLLRAAEKNKVDRYIQQSTTFIYGDHGREIVDETVPIASAAPVPHRRSTVDMEALVKASPLDWVILRGGAFYGAGTGAEDGWRISAREGKLQMPGDGSALVSLCHVTDVARAFVVALEQAPARSVFNVVDDEPVSYRDLLSFIAAQMGAPEPQPKPDLSMLSLGCSNARLKSALGWPPLHPTFRSGLTI